MPRLRMIISLGILVLLVAACGTQYPESCPESTPIGLADADEIASDESLPFRFPLEESSIDEKLYFGWFGVSNQCTPEILAIIDGGCYEYPERLFHAAEDYRRPAGTPVYAMADGKLSFSGTANLYGWLILIDHPQANLYSLYGHLSPSRWTLEAGTEVKRGDLIGYLGDSWENGGTREMPVQTHLHFGIRAGQTRDYFPIGAWHYMGGWIKRCPQDVGWLQPSLIITSQDIPPGGYPQPKTAIWIRMGLEPLIIGIFAIGVAIMLRSSSRDQQRFLLLIQGSIATAAGIIFYNKMLVATYILTGFGIMLLAAGIYSFIRKPSPRQPEQTELTSP